MHELGVTQRVLEIALQHAEAAGADCIADVHIVIGDLSSFVDDSVQFYWDFISEGTIAENAHLHFRRVPTEFDCGDCGLWFKPVGVDLRCPECGGRKLSVAAGDEFYVDAIEVEAVPAGGVS